MVTKNEIKRVKSLELKKHRKQAGAFVAEGMKLVCELLHALPLRAIYVLQSGLDELRREVQAAGQPLELIVEVTEREMHALTLLDTPTPVLALFALLTETCKDDVAWHQDAQQNLVLALDGVQNPGNVGTIIRVADWFGVRHVVASMTTADVYAPKVVQATMGALARVQVHYVADLASALHELPAEVVVMGTFLGGTSLYELPSASLQQGMVVVMGNEGKGITPDVEAVVRQRITIPPFPSEAHTSESLNVAVATSIVCAELRRRELEMGVK